MIEQIKDYNYSKQFIFNENQDKKIQKRLNSDDDVLNVDDYLWSVITTVSQRVIDGKRLSLIQHEDKELGWIELENSIQIFRFPAKHYRVIEDKFTVNELNKKMNIDKDFISHFKGKLLNVKSQVFYDGDVYYSVFIKNKFHGFHSAKVLDELIETEIDLNVDEVRSNVDLHKVSSLTKPVSDIEIESVKLVSFFKECRVGKVIVNDSDAYWLSTKNIKVDDALIVEPEATSIEQLHLDDLFYSVNLERNKSKDIVKTVLAAKDYLKSSKKSKESKKDKDVSFLNTRNQNDELKEKFEELQTSYTELNSQYKRSQKEQKLAQQRLEHQLGYNERLEAQKDKYKARMEFVEGKLKTLDEKYKELKKKSSQ